MWCEGCWVMGDGEGMRVRGGVLLVGLWVESGSVE